MGNAFALQLEGHWFIYPGVTAGVPPLLQGFTTKLMYLFIRLESV